MNNMKNFFFLNNTATTKIYTLPLHAALPTLGQLGRREAVVRRNRHQPRQLQAHVTLEVFRTVLREERHAVAGAQPAREQRRSEEHTSELQSRQYLVCRLLLEKKNQSPALSRS